MKFLGEIINKRKSKKIQYKEEWDPLQDIKALMSAGFTQSQAVTIMNVIGHVVSDSKK